MVKFYQKCIPDFSYKSVYAIPYNGLYIRGITAIFFDLDNTLLTYNQKQISEKMRNFLHDLEEFFQIVIISNNTKKRVKEAIYDEFKYVASAKKPFKFGYKKALKMIQTPSYHVAIVGDQILTDIYGAYRIKAARKILVRPLRKTTDKLPTRINRYFEQKIINKIKKKKPDIFDVRLGNYVKE